MLGDRVPWSSASLVGGGGRPVVLIFLGSPDIPRANEERAALLAEADLFRKDHLIAGLLLTAPPADTAVLAAIGCSRLFFIAKAAGVIASKIMSASFFPKQLRRNLTERSMSSVKKACEISGKPNVPAVCRRQLPQGR